MHHVFLAPVLTTASTRSSSPSLAFVDVPPISDRVSVVPLQSSPTALDRAGPSLSQDYHLAASRQHATSQLPRRTQQSRHPDLSTVVESSSADLSWSISHPHIPPLSACTVPGKRQRTQHGPAPLLPSIRATRRSRLTEPSEESINMGPTPSIMREHLAEGEETRAQGDEVSALPDRFVKASELVRRAIGPRRSSRLRLSEGTTTMAIDLPDSLVSLNTTTTLTPPSQTSAPGLPTWAIPLSRLSPLQSILSPNRASTTRTAKVWVIVCVVSAEPVVQRQRKEEKSRGQEGSLWISSWKVVAPNTGPGGGGAGERPGDEASCTVKLWNEAANEWEGRVRRGDVVLLENVEYKPATPNDPPSLSISIPSFRSATAPKITILYRTLPRRAARGRASDYLPRRLAVLQDVDDRGIIAEDRALRPDLGLHRSDIGIRKVREVADWFARWMGGEGPPV